MSATLIAGSAWMKRLRRSGYKVGSSFFRAVPVKSTPAIGQDQFTAKLLDQNGDRERVREALKQCINYPKVRVTELSRRASVLTTPQFTAPTFEGNRWYWEYKEADAAPTLLVQSRDSALPDDVPTQPDGPEQKGVSLFSVSPRSLHTMGLAQSPAAGDGQ